MKQVTVLFNGRKQATYLLDEPHIVIGRGRSAHIPLDGNPIVSRQHAVIRSELDAHVLEDLGGANGTFVNDKQIGKHTLRPGDRIMGGSMSWGRPATLAPFPETSPFAGLAVPEEVTVQRQVLAEPSLDLAEKTWAALSDGTPLVSAEKRAKGWVVLVHTTANATWSNLALSGAFVEMLERLVGLSQGVVTAAELAPLPPLEIMDGFGRLGPVPAGPHAIEAGRLENVRVGPRHPPGYYGQPTTRRALNLTAGLEAPAAIGPVPDVDLAVLVDLVASMAIR